MALLANGQAAAGSLQRVLACGSASALPLLGRRLFSTCEKKEAVVEGDTLTVQVRGACC